MDKGKLFMLPVPIADGQLADTLPELTIRTARELKFFLAENAKSARAFLKFLGHPCPSLLFLLKKSDIVRIRLRYAAGLNPLSTETISAL